MPYALHIVVCAGIVPDPLQTLEPITAPAGPGIKNEMVLPAVLDPWASSALYEAAALAAKNPGSKLWLVSLGPKGKLQQVMMTIAQKVAFEFVPIDGPIGGFPDAQSTAETLADTIAALPELDRTKLLLFGGWESATRGAGVTLQIVGERLGITDQFQGVDQIDLRDDGSFEVLERVEGGKHQVSVCAGAPAVLGWATGNLAEPRNNPQVGMANMRAIMPALQRAKAAALVANGLRYVSVSQPKLQRTTRVVKDLSADEIAAELAAWIGAE
jgi:electron transfer flavoprotein beta subunit